MGRKDGCYVQRLNASGGCEQDEEDVHTSGCRSNNFFTPVRETFRPNSRTFDLALPIEGILDAVGLKQREGRDRAAGRPFVKEKR